MRINKTRENRVKIISLSVKGKKHVEYVKFFSKEWKRISVSKKANGANGSSDLNSQSEFFNYTEIKHAKIVSKLSIIG